MYTVACLSVTELKMVDQNICARIDLQQNERATATDWNLCIFKTLYNLLLKPKKKIS